MEAKNGKKVKKSKKVQEKKLTIDEQILSFKIEESGSNLSQGQR